MTYEEAMELSYFGATVLHASTIAPAVARGIPIHIKNTLNPRAPGTVIAREGDESHPTKGITAVDGITLLTLRGLSMVGVPGTAERLFRALARRKVNVILISQASSEHTICIAVTRAEAAAASAAVRDEFRFELHHGLTMVDEKAEQTVVAVVGEGMKGRPGVSGDLFGSLGRHGINVSAIAQGASERNISLVIDAAQRVRALNVIHQAFFEPRKRLALVVVGVGNIGGAFLQQLHQQRSDLAARGFDVRVVAVANSRHFALERDGLDLTRWRQALARSRREMSPTALVRALSTLQLTDAALVDCTASEGVVDAYPAFIDAGLHVITPNKHANVLPWPSYQALMDRLRRNQKQFLCEANVGAGLPVISTLNDLVASGDRVRRVEGILSGTLSFLFNSYDGSRPFSEFVRDAHALAFTEPDPRIDLSGQDVARKLLILGRHMGLRMELSDVTVESLVPPSARKGGFSKLSFASLAEGDEAIHRRWSIARSRGRVLRYAGRVSRSSAKGRADRVDARAGLAEYPVDHPFASAKRADNVIAFTTNRYAATPLVVQGPGAGAAVTAMGVFSDMLKLLNSLPR
jgi:aspartokinase/homoserine dehydrogenase 1